MFRFSLQRLLELRAKREQATATELADARVTARMAQDAVDRLAEARQRGGRQMLQAQAGAPVGHLQNASYLLEQLDQQLQTARDAVREAELLVSSRMNEFTAACQERKVLDRLRERHQSSWQAEAVQADLKTMDSIALTRFGSPDRLAGSDEDSR